MIFIKTSNAPLLKMYPMYDICIGLFTAIIVKDYKPLKPIEKCLNKPWYIYRTDYYTAVKKRILVS